MRPDLPAPVLGRRESWRRSGRPGRVGPAYPGWLTERRPVPADAADRVVANQEQQIADRLLQRLRVAGGGFWT